MVVAAVGFFTVVVCAVIAVVSVDVFVAIAVRDCCIVDGVVQQQSAAAKQGSLTEM